MEQLRLHILWLSIPAGFALLGCLALYVDCAVTKLCKMPKCPYCLSAVEPFGNGLGLLLIGITIFILDPGKRHLLFRVLGCAAASGLAANGLKLLWARTRPVDFDLSRPISESFLHVLPGTGVGYASQSFPSAHTATVVAFAIGLAWLYPRGRYWFAFLAVLVMSQRVVTESHFLSDIMWGTAMASFIAIGFYKLGLIPGWIDRLEVWLRGKKTVALPPCDAE